MLIAKSDARGANVVPPLAELALLPPMPGASEGRPIDGRGSAFGARDGRPIVPIPPPFAPFPPPLAPLPPTAPPLPTALFVSALRRTGPKETRFRFRSLSRSRPNVLRRPAIVALARTNAGSKDAR